MSRTYRKILTTTFPQSRITVTRERDGYRTMTLELHRDNRVTGLREHKQERARIRQQLLEGVDVETHPRAGKMRRYTQRYGNWKY